MPARHTEFANELALPSSIAFPERMESIDFTEVITSAPGERLDSQTGEPVLRGKFSKNLIENGIEELGQSKELTAFCDAHRSELARPYKDILKDEAVDRLQMVSIEPAEQRFLPRVRQYGTRWH